MLVRYINRAYISYIILIDSFDHSNYTPLHSAAKAGHTAIIVALIEEGNADINSRGGESGETPLMLTVSL